MIPFYKVKLLSLSDWCNTVGTVGTVRTVILSTWSQPLTIQQLTLLLPELQPWYHGVSPCPSLLHHQSHYNFNEKRKIIQRNDLTLFVLC